MSSPRSVSAARVIRADAGAIFDVLADPARHAAIDGSGTVLNTIDPPARLALGATFAEAIAAVERGAVAVVDVRVAPGYTPAMTAAVSNAERKA